MPDHGPLEVSVAELAQPASPDPARFQAVGGRDAEPNARVFNRDGFFDVAGEPLPPAVGAYLPVTASDPVVARSIGSTAVDCVDTSQRNEFITAAGRVIEARGSDEDDVAASAPKRVHALSPREVNIVPVLAPEGEVDGIEAAGDLAPLRRYVRDLKAARSATHVALHEIEHGLGVAIRLEALGRMEREQIQHEVAALLARHGLSARTIRILAPLARNFPEGRTK